jgi:hypothetical protein
MPPSERNDMEMDEERGPAPTDPTIEADQVDPTTPGPGDSEGARPPLPDETPDEDVEDAPGE